MLNFSLSAYDSTAFLDELRGRVLKIIPSIVKCLQDENDRVRETAIVGLSVLARYGEHQCPLPNNMLSIMVIDELREEIRIAIPKIAECLKDDDEDVRCAAIECLSGLAEYRQYCGAFSE